MDDKSPLEPDWEELGIPIDEDAEPDDAETPHSDEEE